METQLTQEEQLFCELYVNGDAPFAGNAARCYEEAFNKSKKNPQLAATRLIAKEEIQEYLNELDKMSFEEPRYMKKFLTKNLTSIVEECTAREIVNRQGVPTSPAALRSVAVNAAKALMDMYPVKETQKVSLESGDEGGIVFNVIMPGQAKPESAS